MIAADDRFRCIVGNGSERSADFEIKIDTPILDAILDFFFFFVVNN